MFGAGGGVAIDVVDVEAARIWYAEKLGLDFSSTDIEECTMALGYSKEDIQICLCKVIGNERPNVRPGHPPMFLAKKLEDAYELLSAHGVSATPVQSDSGGNRFFRFKDLEGNEVEVCEHF